MTSFNIKHITYNTKKYLKLLLNVKCYLLSYNLGQSILEVLIALTLILLFLSGVVVVQLFALRNLNYSQNKSTATRLARQQLDRVKVVRDSAGIDSLTVCQSNCFINTQLTPVQGITPTGIFDQVVNLSAISPGECPLPDVTVTPVPVSYKVKVKIILKDTASVTTPTPMIELSSCITDWR